MVHVVTEQVISIPSASQSVPLVATLFQPSSESESSEQRPAVLVGSATAVLRQFYSKFARYLAEEYGCVVMTLDYRGIGDSLPSVSTASGPAATTATDTTAAAKHPLIQLSHITMVDWADDLDAALVELRRRYPQKSLVYIGNSIGGHLLPLVQHREWLARAMMVGTANSYYPYSRVPGKMVLLYHVLVPVLCGWYGYFPSKWLGIFEDMPSAAMVQWGAFAGHPRHICSVRRPNVQEAYERRPQGQPPWSTQILAISVHDDDFSGRTGVRKYLHLLQAPSWLRWRHYERDEILQIDPNGVGHFGFFTHPFFWKRYAEWLVDGNPLVDGDVKYHDPRARNVSSKL